MKDYRGFPARLFPQHFVSAAVAPVSTRQCVDNVLILALPLSRSESEQKHHGPPTNTINS